MIAPQGMRAGVIAAGRGDRLRSGSGALKPLVSVGGVPLIHRVLQSIAEAGAVEVVIIINEDSLVVQDHVAAAKWPFTIRWIVETTPSSMHSFLRVVETLSADGDDGPFLISTVDTVAAQGAYTEFVRAAMAHDDADVVLAVGPARHDDRPLLVQRHGDDVVALGERAAGSGWATSGFYAVRASVLAEADGARRDEVSALRSFFGRLLARGYRMIAIEVPDSVDVDRPIDVGAAEDLLRRVTR